jgi:hypothetical protein
MRRYMSVIDSYLAGKKVSEKSLNFALSHLSKYGGQTTIGKYEGETYGADFDKYDTAILGFTNYWNIKLGSTIDGYVPIDANIVKAMVIQESTCGTNSKNNGLLDVMQCLDPRNPAFNILAHTGEGSLRSGGIQSGGFGLFRTVDSSGKYDATNVTPEMSIAGGIRILILKRGDLNRYNVGNPEYTKGISTYLINMGFEKGIDSFKLGW